MFTENIKNKIKTATIWTANRALAQAFFHQVHKQKIFFIAYHGISRNSAEMGAWTIVREKQFYQQMLFIKNNFDCITIDEALHHTLEKRKRPRAVVTFDDGYANNLDIALPLLESFKIPAVIYITTRPMLERELFWPDKIIMATHCSKLKSIDLRGIAEPLGVYNFSSTEKYYQKHILILLEDIKRTDPYKRSEIVEAIVTKFKTATESKSFQLTAENHVFSPLTTEQLTQLGAHPLITIGSHTHCHSILDQISLDQARDSICESKKILEKITGVPIKHFAYPNGNYNASLMKILHDLNFHSAVTMQPGYYKSGDNHFAIRRFGIGSDTSIDLFKVLPTGIFPLKNKFINICNSFRSEIAKKDIGK